MSVSFSSFSGRLAMVGFLPASAIFRLITVKVKTLTNFKIQLFYENPNLFSEPDSNSSGLNLFDRSRRTV